MRLLWPWRGPAVEGGVDGCWTGGDWAAGRGQATSLLIKGLESLKNECIYISVHLQIFLLISDETLRASKLMKGTPPLHWVWHTTANGNVFNTSSLRRWDGKADRWQRCWEWQWCGENSPPLREMKWINSIYNVLEFHPPPPIQESLLPTSVRLKVLPWWEKYSKTKVCMTLLVLHTVVHQHLFLCVRINTPLRYNDTLRWEPWQCLHHNVVKTHRQREREGRGKLRSVMEV